MNPIFLIGIVLTILIIIAIADDDNLDGCI